MERNKITIKELFDLFNFCDSMKIAWVGSDGVKYSKLYDEEEYEDIISKYGNCKVLTIGRLENYLVIGVSNII